MDLAPALIDTAERAAEEGVDVDFEVGDAEEMRTTTRASTRASTLGVMFAPDQRRSRASSRVSRSPADGWRWPAGRRRRPRQMFGMMRPFLPPPPEGAGSPFAWGNEEHVRGPPRQHVRPRVRGARLDPPPSGTARSTGSCSRRPYGPTKTASEELERRAQRGVPPGVGRLLRGPARGRRGRPPPRVRSSRSAPAASATRV